MNTTKTSFISTLKNAPIFMRMVAFIIIFAHTAVIGAPTIDAIKDELSKEQAPEKSPETELSASFVSAIEKLAQLKQLRIEDKNTDAAIGELKTLETKINVLDKSVLENFATIKADLLTKNLPEIILKRHDEMVTHYQKQNKDFMALLAKETKTGFIADIVRGVNNVIDGEEITPDEAAGNAISDGTTTFNTNDFKRSHQAFDPNDLPTRVLQPNKNNKPKETKQEFILSGLRNSPAIQVAALGDFTYTNLEQAADPLYLAETDEVKLTPAVKAKAAELGYDAVKIYEWVNHNVEWMPTWGAMQTSELTLSTLTGNAMDISSLTIALLRASKIPARYVHGTIDVPEDIYTNWVGNFANVDTASDFASAGGIPTITVTRGGKVAVIRMEHIWVEVATDFHPSRGMKNRDADTWIQMDSAFKHHKSVGVITGSFEKNYESIRDTYLSSGTVTDDWMQGLKPNSIDSLLSITPAETQVVATEIQTQFTTHFKNSLGNISFADMIGGRKKDIQTINMLASSLPYEIKLVGVRYDKIPTSLQNQVTFGFYKDIFGEIEGGKTFPYSRLNNEHIELNFTFSSQSDVDALATFINADATTFDEINSSIPSYLIRMDPVLRINGEEVLRGRSMRLGEDLDFSYKVRFSGRPFPKYKSAPIPAGSSVVVGVAGQGISPHKLKELSSKFNQDVAILDKSVEEISAHSNNIYQSMMSKAYYGGMLDYYGKQMVMADAYTKNLGSGEMDLISGVGIMGYVPEVRYFFGMPRSIRKGAIRVDVGHQLFNIRSKTNNPSENFDLAFMIGLYGSQLEADVPTHLFATNTNERGYSATRLLQYANQDNQKIYKITPATSHLVGELNLSSEAITDINAGLRVGKTVITHQNSINGFAGYVIQDPVTGEGAYILDNGTNGALSDTADKLQNACLYDDIGGGPHGEKFILNKISGACNSLAKKMKVEPARAKIASIKTQLDAVGKFMSIYIKLPMVMVDCMVAGAPQKLGTALAGMRSTAAMLSVTTAMPGSLILATYLDKLASAMEEFVDAVHNACLGG